MIKVPYIGWQHILLDTSIIICYLNGLRNPNNERCAFVKRVIDDLNTTPTTKGKRSFYISSITISELLDKSDDTKKAEKIIKALNIRGVTFIPFDNDVAEFMTNKYHSILGTDNLKQIAKDLSFPTHDLLHGRQWLEKDAMIIATAEYSKCDVVLTMDKNTFLPICNKVDFYCAIIEPGNFNHSDTYIFEYDYEIKLVNG